MWALWNVFCAFTVGASALSLHAFTRHLVNSSPQRLLDPQDLLAITTKQDRDTYYHGRPMRTLEVQNLFLQKRIDSGNIDLKDYCNTFGFGCDGGLKRYFEGERFGAAASGAGEQGSDTDPVEFTDTDGDVLRYALRPDDTLISAPPRETFQIPAVVSHCGGTSTPSCNAY